MINQNSSTQHKNTVNPQHSDMKLRDRILEYITHHPQGIRMQELEAEFGESRMHLGYILNKLHSDSNIHKLDYQYFPLPTL